MPGEEDLREVPPRVLAVAQELASHVVEWRALGPVSKEHWYARAECALDIADREEGGEIARLRDELRQARFDADVPLAELREDIARLRAELERIGFYEVQQDETAEAMRVIARQALGWETSAERKLYEDGSVKWPVVGEGDV